jgi:hypothetical protein
MSREFQPASDRAPVQPTSPENVTRSRRRALSAGVGVVAVLLLGLGVWWMTRPAPEVSSVAHASPPPTAPKNSTVAVTEKPTAPLSSAPAPADAIAASASDADSNAGSGGTPESMEDLDGKGGVRGWKIQERYKSQVVLTEEAGNHFLRVTNPDAAKIVFFERKIPLDPSWVAVTVSARMRAIDFKSGSGSMQDGRVNLIFKDEQGVRIGKYPSVPNVRSDVPWTTRSATADVPPGAKSLHLQVGIFNATGTVDFDDITVAPQK